MAEKRPSLTKATKDILSLQKSLEFVPSAEDRKLKAKFWSLERENPTGDHDPELISAARVAEVIGKDISSSWSTPGFRDWFCNSNETKQKAEYIFQLLLDAVERIALSEDPKAYSSQLAAFKALGEYTGNIDSGKSQGLPGLPTDPQELRALVEQMQKRLGVGNAKES